MDPTLPLYIADLMTKAKRLQVIKEIRERTGFPLDRAVMFCNAVEGRRFLQTELPPELGGGNLVSRVRLLQSAGETALAVHLVKEETGMATEEAECFIDCLKSKDKNANTS